MDVDIIVYINKLRKYLEKNEQARQHFIEELDEDVFFDLVTDVAMSNLADKGDPTLTMSQFETIRKLMRVGEITERDEEFYQPIIFIDDRGFDKIIKIK